MTWYDVPYDFGLSAGKTFLTAQTTTEFVLILDDDFVRTPHTSAAIIVRQERNRRVVFTLRPPEASSLSCSIAICVSGTAFYRVCWMFW